MKKSRKVFIDEIKIETQTIFSENGKINIYPCAFEEKRNIVADGDRASQRGRMVTDDDGTSCFHPYAVGSGRRYKVIHQSDYGTVKETKTDYIFQLRFPKHFGKKLIVSMLFKEQGDQRAFAKTIKTRTK